MISKKVNCFSMLVFTGTLVSSVFGEDTRQLEEETVITATRTKENILDVSAAANVITQADLAKYQFVDLADALDVIASADIVRQGGTYGSVTSLFTRGTSSDQTLVLINGQRFSSATLGTTSFQLIDPSMIKRVEYVRGSRSALYGSEALGGVMQISTYGESEDSGASVTLEAGSFNTYKTALSAHANAAGFSISGGISRIESEGIDHLVDDTEMNADDDAFENVSANIFTAYRFPNDAEISLSYIDSQVESDYDSSFSPADPLYRDKALNALQARFFLPVNGVFSSELSVGQSQDHSDELNHIDSPTFRPTYFNTDRQSIYWQNTLELGEITNLIAGIDYYEEEVDALPGYDRQTQEPLAYEKKDRSNFAPFLQLQAMLGRVNVLAGGRVDDNSQFGKHETGSMSLNYHMSDYARFFLSWSEGFKAPTFNDLYWPELGNPDLMPEQSDNYELGIKLQEGDLDWELVSYYSEIDNMIDWAPNDEGVWQPQNINEVEIKGVESSLAKQLDQVHVQLSASYTSSRDKETGVDLDFRSKRKVTFSLTHQLEKLNYGAIVRAYGQRRDQGTKLEAYELVDLFLNYQPLSVLSFGFKVVNGSDEDYRQRRDYNSEGRNYKTSMTLMF